MPEIPETSSGLIRDITPILGALKANRVKGDEVLVRDATEKWLRHRRLSGEISSRSRTLLGSRLTAMINLYGDIPVNCLARREMIEWSHEIGHLAPATRRLYLSAVHCWLEWCVAEGLIAENPSRALPRIREPRRAPRARSHDEILRLYAVARHRRDRAIIALMVQMGLRACEVSRLEVADWDQRSGTMLIHGKGGHERVLPVPDPVAEQVASYREGMAPAGPLICDLTTGRRAVTPQLVATVVGRLLRKAGVKRRGGDGVTAHTLRHTAASDVLDRCNNVRTVQQMLGHQSLATTEIYLRRASLEQLREAMEGRRYDGAA